MAAGIMVVGEETSPKPSSSTWKWGSGSVSSYMGLSFAIFLGFLPRYSISLVSSLQCRNRDLSLKLIQAEEQLRQMKARRKEDSKANARVVEIFASHRNGWQQEEKRLLLQIEASAQEIAHLRARVDHLEQSEAQLRLQVYEREEMINFMSRRPPTSTANAAADDDDIFQEEEEEEEDEYDHTRDHEDDDDDDDFAVEKLEVKEESEVVVGGAAAAARFYATSSQISRASYESYTSRCVPVHVLAPLEGDVANGEFSTTTSSRRRTKFDNELRVSEGLDPVPEEESLCSEGANHNGRGRTTFLSGQQQRRHNDLSSEDFLPSASKVWTHKTTTDYWQQDGQCASLQSSYQAKHFVARRESPWKVDGKSTVPSKLKLLEQELMNLEKIDKGELSKIPSLLRKQAKRYQTLAGKIDDLCRKMRANDPSEASLSSEFRTRHQTEFLIEAYRLQQRAIETGQKLTALQTETAKSNFSSHDVGSDANFTTRRSLDLIRNNLREIQRSLEVWLARIMGDLEGILATDGASRVREYYMSTYPFVQ